MLRNMVNEVVSRRMWPIPLVAIVVAVAAPLLFMKGGADTPVSSAPPPIAQPGKLPTGAERLVSNEDKSAATGTKSKSKGQDPFAPPKSAEPKSEPPAPAAAAAAPAASSGAAVQIQNSDGSTSTQTVPATTTRQAAPRGATSTSTRKTTTKRSSSTKKSTTTRKSTPKATAPAETTTYVDVRFGERKDTYLRYRVPRLQTFRAGGRIAAMFVRYSPARDVAVFAVAPSTKVKGDVTCRTIKGVCRYVDLPEGKYVRLVLRDMDGRLISRRLDVVNIRTLAGKEDASPRENPLEIATCLLKGLLKLPSSLPSITSDACA